MTYIGSQQYLESCYAVRKSRECLPASIALTLAAEFYTPIPEGAQHLRLLKRR